MGHVNRIVLAFLLLPLLARAQSMPIDSLWAPWASGISAQATVYPLTWDSTGNLMPIASQGQPLPLAFSQSPVTLTFPGQSTAVMTVAGVRMFSVATGTGWSGTSQIDVPFPSAVAVPAGQTLMVTYTAPLLGQGTLQWVVGAATGSPPPPPPAGVTISPTSVSLVSTSTSRTGNFVLTLNNGTASAVTATYDDSVAWLVAISPGLTLDLDSGATDSFTLTYDTSTLSRGTYTGKATIAVAGVTTTITYTMKVQ
jgi:hypothetical protein